MMTTETDIRLRRRVMRRVYLTYCTRQVCKPVPRLLVLGVLLLALVGSVSIVNVIANAFNTSGIAGFANFILAAFLNTDATVQLVAVLSAGMIAWFAYDTARRFELVTTTELPV